MTLEQYLAILLKRWWLVLFCCLAVGVGAYVGSKFVTPLYQSSALIQVSIRSSGNQADYNSLLASDQLVQTEAQLVTSDPVLREVASHHPGLSATLLAHEVSATPKVNTQLFEIDVLDPSPKRAALIANDIATTFIGQQRRGVEQDNSQSQQEIQHDLDTTQQQIDTFTTQIVAAQQSNPVNQTQIAIWQARINALQQHYTQWQTLLAQLKLTEAQSSDYLRIVQNAQTGIGPVQPNRTLYVASGLVLGLLLGLLLIVLLEKLDTRVRTPEDLTQLLDWTVLATIWQANAKENVINPSGSNSNIESYRILRTSLGFSAIDKPLRFLMVTSAMPNDGKSVIAANLAIFMAKSGKHTLLIDADMRRPIQQHHFDLAPDLMGLSNAVLAMSVPNIVSTSSLLEADASLPKIPAPDVSLEPFIHAADIPNLWIMPSGPLPPNPPELLDSKAMRSVLDVVAKGKFEMVIFDTPPFLGLSDGGILASKVDGILIVADITRANKGHLKQMKSLLTQTGIRVVGCVVNKQHRGRKEPPYYSHYTPTDEQNSTKDHSPQSAPPPTVPVHGVNTVTQKLLHTSNTSSNEEGDSA